jgi:hypothetical protein
VVRCCCCCCCCCSLSYSWMHKNVRSPTSSKHWTIFSSHSTCLYLEDDDGGTFSKHTSLIAYDFATIHKCIPGSCFFVECLKFCLIVVINRVFKRSYSTMEFSKKQITIKYSPSHLPIVI